MSQMNQPLIHPSNELEIVAAEEHAMSKLLDLAIQPDGMGIYLQKGIEMMIELIPYLQIWPSGCIFLTEVNEFEHQLKLVAQYNLSPQLQEHCRQVQFGDCVCGSAALDQEIKFASCLSDRPEGMHSGTHVYGNIALPIMAENSVAGVILLCLPQGHEKTEREVSFLKRVAKVFGLGISNRNVMKALRKANEKAQQSNNARIEFLNKVSHELRTPLNGIIGLTQALECTDLDDEQEEIIDTLLINGKSLLALINDILGYSDISSGRLKAENSDFSLKDIFNGVKSHIADKNEGKNHILNITIEQSFPDLLNGAPRSLEKVLVNLVNNSIKFSNQADPINITVSVREKHKESLTALFSVEDSGIGMTPEVQSRLFKQFDQADNSTRRRYGGLGIGLVVCKELVRMMGGEIWVKSKPGHGSTFFFTVELKTE